MLETATLKVDMSDNSYYGGTLVVTIDDTVNGESWFDTTEVTIALIAPSCTITLADLALQEATAVLTLQATRGIDTDTFSLATLQTHADTVF